jgi:hypothetical protein
MRPPGSILLSIVAVLTVSASAAANTTVSLSMQLPAEANQRIPIPFSYVAKGLSKHAALVVQRQMGATKTFVTILRLPNKTKGYDKLPGLRIGQDRIRIAVSGVPRVHIASRAHTVRVFGNIPFSTLFSATGTAVVSFNGGQSGEAGDVTTSTGAFHWTLGGVAGADSPDVHVANNTCRHIHIDFVSGFPNGTDHYFDGSTGGFTLVQETRDPVTVVVPYNHFASIDTNLVPGRSWSLTSIFNFDPSHGPQNPDYIYGNGFANCFSSLSFRS